MSETTPADPVTTNTSRRVLFISSNGAGVGHLMRLMAMARRAHPEVTPLFLTMSQAVPVVIGAGFHAEYLMSSGFSGMPSSAWHALLQARLREIIAIHEVSALVFDGTWPYRGLLEASHEHPDVASVWSRRAMWKPDLDSPAPAASSRFDLIIEPGEFAEAIDEGQTVARRAEATRVAPITFLDRDEMLDRGEARRVLGLDPDRPAALVQLGAGNINDTSSLLGAVVERLAERDDLQVCVTKSIISESGADLASRAIPLAGIYPLAKYLRAFDMAVAAPGYNTFHELLAAAVPTLFVPNLDTKADNQAARSRYAAAAGVALDAASTDPTSVTDALDQLLDESRRDDLAAAAARRVPGNGAGDAMAAIEQLIGLGPGPTADAPVGDLGPIPELPAATRRSPQATVATATATEAFAVREADPEPSPSMVELAATRLIESDAATTRMLKRLFYSMPAIMRRPIRRRLAPSQFRPVGGQTNRALMLPVPRPTADEPQPRPTGVAVVLPDTLTPDERDNVLDRLVGMQVDLPALAPLVLTFDGDLAPLRERGLPVELLPSPEVWSRVQEGESWAVQLRARIEHINDIWDLRRFVALGPVGDIDELELAVLTATAPQMRPARSGPA